MDKFIMWLFIIASVSSVGTYIALELISGRIP